MYELPYKEDLEYLYIFLNLRKCDLSVLFNVSTSSISIFLRKLNIQKPNTLRHQNVVKFWIENLGVINQFQHKTIIEKSKKTNISKYGVENYTKTSEYTIKSKKTKLCRYGNETFNNREKAIQTCNFKYNVDNVSQVKEFQDKKQITFLSHYGYLSNFHNPKYKKYLHSKEIIDRQCKTRIKNKTFRTSKLEEKIYKLFLKNNIYVKRQYKSDLYPYYCDFYIPKDDIYIEIQGDQCHGIKPYRLPFDKNNDEHIKHLQWIEDTKPYRWKSCLKIWAIKDVEKRETARKNGLFWLEFFEYKDFLAWFKSYLPELPNPPILTPSVSSSSVVPNGKKIP